MRLTDKRRESRIIARIKALVDGHDVPLAAIAQKSGIDKGTVRTLYEQDGVKKQRIAESNAAKLEKGLDAIEVDVGMTRQCGSCGRVLPYGMFSRNKGKRDGINTICKECTKKQDVERRSTKVNNNTQEAITAEIVRKVKEEDKRDVESKFMAAYFKLTPKQLDEIRRGVWDKLLLTPKTPKRADTVLQAVENLRDEVALLRREVETVLIEMGVEVKLKEEAQ